MILTAVMYTLYNLRPKGFNIGNDVIHLAIQYFLRETFGSDFSLISLPATSRYEAHRKAGISAGTVFEMNRLGDGLIVGGGNLYENNELEVNPVAINALEIPMIIFSVSRGKVYNRKHELVDRTDVMPASKIKLLNESADISLSRDPATHSYIKDELGVDNIMGACPTMFIDQMPQHDVTTSQKVKSDCLISIRTPNLMSVSVQKQNQVCEDLLAMISELKSRGYHDVRFLCHDHRDIPFASSFTDIPYVYTEDVYAYLTYLKHTRLNITYRLHSFIPCMAYGVPTIKISYDQRALSLVDAIGLDDWNINHVLEDTVTEVKDRLDRLDELPGINKQVKKDVWQGMEAVIRDNVKRFAQLVDERRS
ncbi:MAG: polysaccharide pyruvyl transferase family protein [Bacteroidota bacterium]